MKIGILTSANDTSFSVKAFQLTLVHGLPHVLFVVPSVETQGCSAQEGRQCGVCAVQLLDMCAASQAAQGAAGHAGAGLFGTGRTCCFWPLLLATR